MHKILVMIRNGRITKIIRYSEKRISKYKSKNRNVAMPPLFTSNEKIKVIEYGHHANDDFPVDEIKAFFGKFLKLKSA